MESLIRALLDRLKEKSTWATLITIVVSVTGIQLAPEQQEAITSAAITVLGLIGVFWNEKPPAA